MPTKPTQTKRKYKSHPFSERKRVVELYESGLGCKRIARAMDLDASTVRMWLRRYRAKGLESLHPYDGRGADGHPPGVHTARGMANERLFSPAFSVYATTLEPVASITRRYGLDYNGFLYHVRRYHPELTEQRTRLQIGIAGEAAPVIPSEAKESSETKQS